MSKIETPSVHLVIACWSGARRGQPYSKSYVPDQLEWLSRTRHDLVDCVTFVDARAGQPHPDHNSNLRRAESLGYRVYRRSNSEMSYGSYADAFVLYGSEPFTHWLFIEDDYVLVRDDFDVEFVKMYRLILGEDGYLCSLVRDSGGQYGRHGVCSIGMVSTKSARHVQCLSRRFSKHQGRFTNMFGPLEDTTDFFKTIFFRGWAVIEKRYIIVGDGLPELVVPVQCLGVPHCVLDRWSSIPLEDI